MTAPLRYVGYTHLVAIGACYIDTILSVPNYPGEDSKQRASSLTKRRGGNCPNTLEVLQQLLPLQSGTTDTGLIDRTILQRLPQIVLVSTLPSKSSADANFIAESFKPKHTTSNEESLYEVDLSHVLHRSQDTAASSYIVQSEATNSRTIVNYNALEEMTFNEFQCAVTSLLESSSASLPKGTNPKLWFHFEGRIPEVTLQCILWLRSTLPDKGVRFAVSVECEKPNRPGLKELAYQANAVFYSRSWAEGQGYTTASTCLTREAVRILGTRQNENLGEQGDSLVLCCTWGAEGASLFVSHFYNSTIGIVRHVAEHDSWPIYNQHPWQPWPPEPMNVVDTVGAGDTWIAGMLFGFLCRPQWKERDRLEFANELAGRKVLRHGFGGLGREMKERMGEMEMTGLWEKMEE